MEQLKYEARVPKAQADKEETTKASGDVLKSQFVTSGIRYAKKITPGDDALGGETAPCDFILVDTDLTIVTYAPAENDDDTTVATPLKAGQWHRISATDITAVGAGNVWAGWIRRPPAAP